MTRQERQARMGQLQRQQAKYEKIWQPRIETVLDAQIQPVIDYLLGHSIPETQALLPTLLKPGKLGPTLNKLYLSVGTAAANDEYGILIKKNPDILQEKSFGFNQIWRDLIQQFFDYFGGRKITNMMSTDQEIINQKLQWALDHGYDTINAAKMIRQSDVNLYRSRLIARTEILGASGIGGKLGANQTGLQMNKTWLSVKRKTTRRLPEDQFDHYHMDGVSIPMDDKFVVMGRHGPELMDQPGDQDGTSAGNVCNCLCKAIYEPQRDRNGRLIKV